VAVNSGGKAIIGVFNDPEFSTTSARYVAFMQWIKVYCPGCKVAAQVKFANSEIGTTLEDKTKTMLEANPDINWLFTPYDGAATAVVPAVLDLGLHNIKLVSSDGDLQNLGYIHNHQVEVAVYGDAIEWAGWAAVDAANRLFNGQKPVLTMPGHRMMVLSSLPPSGQPFTGDQNYTAEYLKLWGIKS
jgi:ribose transport system substrate-binding protein